MYRITAFVLFAVVSLGPLLGSTAWAQSYGKAERRDPIFLRFAEMANRYWVNTETNSASHKVVAVPMPRQSWSALAWIAFTVAGRSAALATGTGGISLRAPVWVS